MTWNEYCEQVKKDAVEYVEENYSYCDSWDDMTEDIFMDDSVTGNASGSYFCNSYKAAEAVQGIIFDDDALDAFKAYDYDHIPTEQGPEACDVIARCIALDYGALEAAEGLYYELKANEDEGK